MGNSTAAKQRVPWSPLPAVPTSAVACAKHRLQFNASIFQLLTLQLSKKNLKKKKNPFSLSHHALAQQLYFPVVPVLGEHIAVEPDPRSETPFCEKPGCSPHCQLSAKLISFFSFSYLISPTSFSNIQSCKNVHFCITTSHFSL